jgi:hypothetical protein
MKEFHRSKLIDPSIIKTKSLQGYIIIKMKILLYIIVSMTLLAPGCIEITRVGESPAQKMESYFPQSEYEKDFIFPPIMGPLTLTSRIDYEKTSPGLGYSTKYIDNIAAMEIYVYDSQNKFIPDDINSPFVLRAFQDAVSDILALGKNGTFSRLSYSVARGMTLSGKNMYMVTFQLTQDDNEKFCVLMLTVHRGKFFKVWLTIDKGKDPDYVDDSIRLLEEITQELLLEDLARRYLI